MSNRIRDRIPTSRPAARPRAKKHSTGFRSTHLARAARFEQLEDRLTLTCPMDVTILASELTTALGRPQSIAIRDVTGGFAGQDFSTSLPEGTYRLRAVNTDYGSFTIADNGSGTCMIGGTTGAVVATGDVISIDKSKLAAVTVQGSELVTGLGRAQAIVVGDVAPGFAGQDETLFLPAGGYRLRVGAVDTNYGTFQVADDGSGSLFVSATTGAAVASDNVISFDVCDLHQVIVTTDPAAGFSVKNVVSSTGTDTVALPIGSYTLVMGSSAFNFTLSEESLFHDDLPPEVALSLTTCHVSMTGLVFNDLDNDGIYESGDGELGLGGVPVTLTGADDQGAVNLTTTTLADGSYLFEDILPGTYSIAAEQPVGFLDGKETAGTLGGTVDNTQDSNTISGIVIGTDGADATGYDFANIQPSELQGLVWQDFNKDGELNFSEKALEGVAIALAGTDDRGNAVNLPTQTDVDGVYRFVDLRPGDYTLTQTQPAGFDDGLDVIGTVNGSPVGDNAVNDVISGLVLSSPSSVAENYNFGERPPAGVGLVDGTLLVMGTDGVDQVQISDDGDQLKVQADLDSGALVIEQLFNKVDVDDISVILCADHDQAQVSFDVNTPTFIDGGEGSDQLQSGSGNDTVLGGPGNDQIQLQGGRGDNLLDGGSGDDHLQGGEGKDKLLGGPGNDNLQAGSGNNPLDGGPGDDYLQAADGADILLGGEGSDTLQSGAGLDLLIGGLGADLLLGDSGEDVLIGGTTAYDADDQALLAIFAGWNSSESYNTRVANIRDGGGSYSGPLLNSATVFDDGAVDELLAGGELDWFFAKLGEDLLDNLESGEVVTAI